MGVAELMGSDGWWDGGMIDLKDKFCLEPETSIYQWLFQLDDSNISNSLHKKWLFYQTSICKRLVVSGTRCESDESQQEYEYKSLFVESRCC